MSASAANNRPAKKWSPHYWLGSPLETRPYVDVDAVYRIAILAHYATVMLRDPQQDLAGVVDYFAGQGGFDRVEPVVADAKSGWQAALVCQIDSRAVVLFVGADARSQWLPGYDLTAVDLLGGRAAKGVAVRYGGIAGKVADIIQPYGTGVAFCGYGLSGGVAALAGLEHANAGRPLHSVVTFGQPALGDQRLARAMTKRLRGKYVRVISSEDPTRNLPPHLEASGSTVACRHAGIKLGGWEANDAEPSFWQNMFGSGPSLMRGDEFERLRAEAAAVTPPTETDPETGRLPMPSDHAMRVYQEDARCRT